MPPRPKIDTENFEWNILTLTAQGDCIPVANFSFHPPPSLTCIASREEEKKYVNVQKSQNALKRYWPST